MGYDVLSDSESPASRTVGGRVRTLTIRTPGNPSHQGTLRGTANLSTALLTKRPSTISPRGKRNSTSPASPSSRTSSPSWKTQVIAQLSVSTTNASHPQLPAISSISPRARATLEGQPDRSSSFGQLSGKTTETQESIATQAKKSQKTTGTGASSGSSPEGERSWRRRNLMVNTEAEETLPLIEVPTSEDVDDESLESLVGPGRCFETQHILSPTSKKIGDVFGTQHNTRLVQELRWYLLFIEEQLVVELRSFLPKCVRRVNLDSKHTVITRMRGAVLFADVSGFTAMTEKLAEKKNGAETLSACLNKFFTPMIDIITAYRGDVIKFSGDALTIVFEETVDNGIGAWTPCGTPGCDHNAFELACIRACACSLEIHKKLHHFDIGVDVKLATHIGVGAGKLAMLQVGGMYKRYEYAIVGLPLEQIAQACPLAEPGETVLSPETWDIVSPFFKKGPPLPKGSAPGYDLLESIKPMHTLAQVKHAATLCLNGFMMTPRGKYDWATRTDRLKRFIPRAVVQHFQAGTAGNVNEMRNVTIVFVQISSQNVLSDQGSEIAQMIMLAMQRATYGMEGNVNKFLVDDKGLLIVAAFGLPPLVHFDDPLRAIICCFDMIESLHEMGIDGRFGITTGRVFCGIVGSNSRREYTVMGDTVNLSARLMASTDSLTVLIDQPTYLRVIDDVECEVLPPIKVKGKEELIAVYRPKNPREVSVGVSCRKRKTWGRRETAIGFTQLPWRAGSEMFGGASLLTSLEKWESRNKLESIYRMGENGYHFLTGPSGGGKVELCEHAVHLAVKGHSALGFGITHCLQGEMFRPLMHILDSLFQALLLYGQGSMQEWLTENDKDRHLLTMLGLVKNETTKRRMSDLYTLEAGTEKAAKIEGESQDLTKRLIDRITKVKPILVTLRECVGPTIFLAPRNIFWNLANFLIETYGKSEVRPGFFPVWIQIVAREIPPSTIGFATPDRSVHCESLTEHETKELAEQCLLAHAAQAAPSEAYKLEITRPDIERLYCFLSEVALNNACFIQESIAQLIASKNIAIEGSKISVSGQLSEIDIVKWSHTRMVGGAQAKIECLRPAQQQVLKIAAVFENHFSALDLQAANSAIFCRKGGFVTLYDLVKSVMAAESLVREGILVRYVYPPGAEITDKALPETWRWTISKFLLRKIAASSVLQSQRVLIKRCALIGRALRLELPKRMAIKGSQNGASLTLSSIRSLLKKNASQFMEIKREKEAGDGSDSDEKTPATAEVNTFASDLLVESRLTPDEAANTSSPVLDYAIKVIDTNVSDGIQEPTLHNTPPSVTERAVPACDVEFNTAPAADGAFYVGSARQPSSERSNEDPHASPLPSFDTPNPPEVCGVTFTSSRSLPLRLECSAVPIIPGWRVSRPPAIPSRRMKLKIRRSTAVTIAEGLTDIFTDFPRSVNIRAECDDSRTTGTDIGNATIDTESLIVNDPGRGTITTIPCSTRFPIGRQRTSTDQYLVGGCTGLPFVRIVQEEKEDARSVLNPADNDVRHVEEERSSNISDDKQRACGKDRPLTHCAVNSTRAEPSIAKSADDQRAPATTSSSSSTAPIHGVVMSVSPQRDAVRPQDAIVGINKQTSFDKTLAPIPFSSVHIIGGDSATESRTPPGILRQEHDCSVTEDIPDEDPTISPQTRGSKSSSRTSKTTKSGKRAVLCPVVTYISGSGSQHLENTPGGTPDSSCDEGRSKSASTSEKIQLPQHSNLGSMFTYTPNTLRHVIAKYDAFPAMEADTKRAVAADRLKELSRSRGREDDLSSNRVTVGSHTNPSCGTTAKRCSTARDDTNYYTMPENDRSRHKVRLDRKVEHSAECCVPHTTSKKSTTSVKWADEPEERLCEMLVRPIQPHHHTVRRAVSHDSLASHTDTVGRTTLDTGSYNSTGGLDPRGDQDPNSSYRKHGRETTTLVKDNDTVERGHSVRVSAQRRSTRGEHRNASTKRDIGTQASGKSPMRDFGPDENAHVSVFASYHSRHTTEASKQDGQSSSRRKTCTLTHSHTAPSAIGSTYTDST